MDREKQTPEKDEQERERSGEDAREQLDQVPPPGTDPLHEGP